MAKIVIVIAALVVIIAALGVRQFGTPILRAGSGFRSKTLCSGIFVSGRTREQIESSELHGDGDPLYVLLATLVNSRVDFENKFVETTDRLGLGICKLAVFRGNALGCTLLHDASEPNHGADLLSLDRSESESESESEFQLTVSRRRDDVDYERLDAALDEAFRERVEGRALKRTRAIVVMRDGEIVAERYGGEFDRDTPQLAWSMTKTMLAALVGIRLESGHFGDITLDGDDDAPATTKNAFGARHVPEWPAHDAAGRSLADMLRMSAGVDFADAYHVTGGVVEMLFDANSTAGYAARKPLVAKPHWAYSSGVTNMMSRALRDTFDGNDEAYWRFARDALFEPLGMSSAVMELDAAGTFVGSSFSYATPRDLARFGQAMFVEHGRAADGRQVVPEHFARWMTQPCDANPHYGGQTWLNFDGFAPTDDSLRPVYAALGHDCQAIYALPEHRLVVVRLGLTKKHHKQCHMNQLLLDIVDSLRMRSAIM
jgi:CubicO group peptidase (beta-lactamase class C family)